MQIPLEMEIRKNKSSLIIAMVTLIFFYFDDITYYRILTSFM